MLIDLIVQTGGGDNLRSDKDYLYFLRNNSILGEKTDAPPILFDQQAAAIEIVQFMQTLNADQGLIAGKQGPMATWNSIRPLGLPAKLFRFTLRERGPRKT